MTHEIYKIKSFSIAAAYTLEIVFDDGLLKTINFEPILYGSLYGKLRDTNFFNSVYLDPEVCTLVWPNGADFDPALLHNWEDNFAALVERTSKWRTYAKV
jgi:hypothetical protein